MGFRKLLDFVLTLSLRLVTLCQYCLDTGVNIMSGSNLNIKEATLQLRVSSQQKDILSQAAKLLRTTLSNFVLANAYKAAQQVLTDQIHFTLSPEQWNSFCQALDQPARDIPALKALLEEPGVLDG